MAKAVERGAYIEPPFSLIWAIAVGLSWQEKHAAVIGEVTSVVSAAMHGADVVQTHGAACVHAVPRYVPLVMLLVENPLP